MDIKKFARTYDLDLIVASTGEIILGTLVWDSLFRRIKFVGSGMPDTVYIGLQAGGSIVEATRHELENMAKAAPLTSANLAGVTAKTTFEGAVELGYPNIGKVQADSKISQAKSFEFGDLQARVMTSDMRVRLDGYLDSIKKDNWGHYFGNLRRLFIVTELYYGAFKMTIDSSAESDVDVELVQLGITGAAKEKRGSNTQYTFGKVDVPFAMRVERLRDFEG